MVKIITFSLIAVLTGCASNPVPVVTDTIEVHVPLLYCPAPPIISRPDLPIHNMTPAQQADDGEVAKHWKATIRVLIDHSKNQEAALDEYNNINMSYEELRKQMQKIDDSKAKQ